MKPLAATVTLPQPTACPYCGMGHLGTCPRVKAMEYHPDGTLKRVEFHGPQPVAVTGGLDMMVGGPAGASSEPYQYQATPNITTGTWP